MKKNILINITLMLIFATNCRGINVQEKTESKEDCIQPESVFAYPIDKYGMPDFVSEANILPGNSWQVISMIEDESVDYSSLKMVNKSSKGSEVWVEVTRNEKGEKSQTSYFIYNSEEKNWREINQVYNQQYEEIYGIYQTYDGEIYALNTIKTNQDACFSQYDAISNQFVSIASSIALPCSTETLSGNLSVFDPNGYFWLLVDQDGIYRYKISNGKYEKLLDTDKFEFSKASITKDGSIYFTDQTKNMYHFNPNDSTYTSFTIPFRKWNSAFNFYVDEKERIWFGQLGWRDAEGNWFEYVEQPEFVPIKEMELNKADPFVFVNPYLDIATVTSDDSVWLNSFSGIYKANVNEGKWCWITTEYSNVIEDKEGYVWLLVDNKLYKSPIGK